MDIRKVTGGICSANDAGLSPTIWTPMEFLDMQNSNLQFVMLIMNCPIECERDKMLSMWNRAALRITVDGGTDRWFSFLNGAHCIPPDYITGDMDSASMEAVNMYKSQGTQLVFTPDQNESDFTKALKHVQVQLKTRSLKVDGVIAVADTSGRLDQIFANINTLYLAAEILGGIPVFQLASNSLSWLLRPGSHEIHIPEQLQQLWCSLTPVGSKARSVSTSGLKWNLDDYCLKFGGLVSSSNSYCGSPVTVLTDSTLLWSMGIRNS